MTTESNHHSWGVAKELNINHSVVIRHLKQIGKVKKLRKWVPHELTENQKNRRFEVSSSLHSTQQWTISWSDCDMQRKVDFMTIGNDQLGGWTKKKLQSTSKSETCIRKRSWSLFDSLLPAWSTAKFLNPTETITSEKYAQQIDEMHWKPQYLQPALVNRKGPIFLHDVGPHVTPTLQKLNELGYKVLPHLPYSPDFSPTTSSSISTTFCKENASKSSSNAEAWIFTLQEETFLTGKNVLIVMVPILINKDVFKPSYNDIKFMVQNCNYFCTNLVVLQWKNLAHITKKSKWSSSVMWHHRPGDTFHWKGYNVTSIVFMQNMHNLNLVKEKH